MLLITAFAAGQGGDFFIFVKNIEKWKFSFGNYKDIAPPANWHNINMYCIINTHIQDVFLYHFYKKESFYETNQKAFGICHEFDYGG